MNEDRQGNRLSGATPEAVAHFDEAVREFNIYRGDPVATVDRAAMRAASTRRPAQWNPATRPC